MQQHPGAWMPNQFANPANPDIHRLTTGPEILAQVPHLDAGEGYLSTDLFD